jgi:hypothetical protein
MLKLHLRNRLLRAAMGTGLAAIVALTATNAAAHVKWFAPYIVGAPPRPLETVIQNSWFWMGMALVVVFFILTRAIEISRFGTPVFNALDRVTGPLWARIDDYVRVVVGAFFVAIFAVGGVYLTPDLKTPAEWVSWLQLLIAALIFSRRTMPLAGLGIIALWVLAARDYDLFHLFDYLALGLGVAGYLILEPMKEEWRAHRFEVLRWGLAIALMWSSLEKFAYPEWFYPLVLEKPYLTFGMPRDVFIPMAGVAEFTMGFGLLWTALIRRLSAIALIVIFTSAVWPFGRIDLIGHGLISAILVAVACDQSRAAGVLATLKQNLPAIPAGLAVLMLIFMGGYWGLHLAFYGAEGFSGPATADKATHSHSSEYPHGPESDTGIGAPPNRNEAE